MSSFCRITKNPKTGKMEVAEWLDDYFGQHQYGVRFRDGEVVNAIQFKSRDIGDYCDPHNWGKFKENNMKKKRGRPKKVPEIIKEGKCIKIYDKLKSYANLLTKTINYLLGDK